MMTVTAIITMAGFGRRFLEVGYTVPKYRIRVHGRTLFTWSMLSLYSFIKSGADFVFVVRAADQAADFIRREAADLGIRRFDLVELDAPTDGQATTALLAEPAVAEPSAPMLIYNIDTFVHPDSISAAAARGYGWIPCFDAPGDHWSFVALNADGKAVQVSEKTRISRHATVGLYWFCSFELYRNTYRRYYSDPANLQKGERYCAPLYNELIAAGRDVFVTDIPPESVIPLGTPAEVEAFQGASAPALLV
jgi:dTDP-glucose pyrophosphorylase